MTLLRVDTVLGPSGDAVMAVVLCLLICVVAGYLVRISFLKRVSDRIVEHFPPILSRWFQNFPMTATVISTGMTKMNP